MKYCYYRRQTILHNFMSCDVQVDSIDLITTSVLLPPTPRGLRNGCLRDSGSPINQKWDDYHSYLAAQWSTPSQGFQLISKMIYTSELAEVDKDYIESRLTFISDSTDVCISLENSICWMEDEKFTRSTIYHVIQCIMNAHRTCMLDINIFICVAFSVCISWFRKEKFT